MARSCSILASFGKYEKVLKLSYEGRLKEALQLLEFEAHQTSEARRSVLVCLLRGCTRWKALEEGKQVHAHIQAKYSTNILLSNLLIIMYSTCGSVAEALKVFTAMPQRNVFSWAAMISAHAKSRQYEKAFTLLQQMHQAEVELDEVACVVMVKACADVAALELGQHLHSLILKKGFNSNLIIQNALLNMYLKCGCLTYAHQLFDKMTKRDVVSWTTMIAGYTQEGLGKDALVLYEKMTLEGIEPNNMTLVLLLKACGSISALLQGRQLHSLVLKKGLGSQLIIQNTLIDMYSKCGCLKDARRLFDNMSGQNVVTWNAMIAGYAQEGLGEEALSLYEQMKRQDIAPDDITLVLLLKACASIAALQQGKQLHFLILEKGLESQLVVQTTLLHMYSKCGCLEDARKLFDEIIERNVVAWNAIIAGYVEEGLGDGALDLYEQMKCEGIEPNNITLVILLKACASIQALQQGKSLHSLILKRGLESQPIFQTSLLNMYAKCRCLNDAHELFNNMTERNVVSWTAMIGGYAQEGLGKEALDLYRQMMREGIEPNNITFVLLLKACASTSDLQQGKWLHSVILNRGLECQPIIQTSLLDMYSKCGSLRDACELFDNMTGRAVVSWNTIIAGYAQEGFVKEALDLCEQMKREGMEPNVITLVLLLKACANVSSLQQGKQLHSLILEKGLESQLIIQNTLIDMYSKCGCLTDACELFDNMTARDVVSWTAMIAGYAQKGLGKKALDLFWQMKDDGLQANDITYTCVLSACNHSGLVDEGLHVFESMSKGSGVMPTLEHYACMVDLLGRAGLLSDAEDLIMKMPILPVNTVWMSLLGAARKYVNVEIGRRAFERCVELGPENAAPYLLLIDIFSSAGMMDEVAQLRKEMNGKGL